MKEKEKFKPVVTRIKLNPEQAILNCPCYNTGNTLGSLAPKRIICMGTTPQDKSLSPYNYKYASGGTSS